MASKVSAFICVLFFPFFFSINRTSSQGKGVMAKSNLAKISIKIQLFLIIA